MKIAKLSLNGYSNYGNLLQHYALQKYLLHYAGKVDAILIANNKYLPFDWWKWSWKEPIKWLINWKGFRDNFKTGHLCIDMARQARMRDFAFYGQVPALENSIGWDSNYSCAYTLFNSTCKMFSHEYIFFK